MIFSHITIIYYHPLNSAKQTRILVAFFHHRSLTFFGFWASTPLCESRRKFAHKTRATTARSSIKERRSEASGTFKRFPGAREFPERSTQDFTLTSLLNPLTIRWVQQHFSNARSTGGSLPALPSHESPSIFAGAITRVSDTGVAFRYASPDAPRSA